MVAVSHRALKIALIAEVPLLLVALALFAWAIHALADAEAFVNLAVNRSASGDRARWGLDLGTQVLTWTTTITGTATLSSAVVSWAPWRFYSVYTENGTSYRSSSTEYRPTATTIPAGTTSGTVTATYTQFIYPGAYGTVGLADAYARAGVEDPSTLPSWQTGEYDRYLSSLDPSISTLPSPQASSTSTPSTSFPSTTPSQPLPRGEAAPTSAPLVVRDGSWSEGWTQDSIDDGLYGISWDQWNDLRIWISLFSVCLVAVVMRLVGNVVYATLTPRKSTTVLLLCMATIASAFLLGCGVALWYYFERWQTLNAADVRATFAFWILVTLTSLVLVAPAAMETNRFTAKGSRNAQRVDSLDRSETGSTALDHEAPLGRDK